MDSTTHSVMTFRSSIDVLKFLGKFTYKPGYKLQFWVDSERKLKRDQSIVMNMVIPVPDSTRADHKEVNIVFRQGVALEHILRGGPDFLGQLVKDFILKWERHEMDEWFRYEGRILENPHANESL